MIDSLLAHVGAARAAAPWERFGVEPGGYALVTLHRPALVDDPQRLRETAEALSELARETPIVFPVHPRTQARLEAFEVDTSALVVAEPLGYLDFLGLEAEARFLLTDSGGVQEETSALGVPCFTLRDTTERPVTVELGTNTLLGLRPERIREIPTLLRAPREATAIPLWDGDAGVRSGDVLADALEGAYVRN